MPTGGRIVGWPGKVVRGGEVRREDAFDLDGGDGQGGPRRVRIQAWTVSWSGGSAERAISAAVRDSSTATTMAASWSGQIILAFHHVGSLHSAPQDESRGSEDS